MSYIVNPSSFYCSADDLALRHTAIAWLGVLLRDQFPSLFPLGGDVTPSGILYRMVGGGDFSGAILPVLNERLRVLFLDALRADEGVASSREMMRSNAIAFLQARKESHLADHILEQEEDLDVASNSLLALVHIGKHVEPVPFPHAPSIEPLRYMHIISIERKETQLRGKPRQVWVFRARLASSSQDIKKWAKQQNSPRAAKDAKQTTKQPLWLELEKTDQVVWTLEGMRLRFTLLEGWRNQLHQLHYPQILTQGDSADESLPWGENLTQECLQWSARITACGLQRAAECRNVLIDAENDLEGLPGFYGTSPESFAHVPRDLLGAEVLKHIPLLFSSVAPQVENVRIVLLTPSQVNASARLCIEAITSSMAVLFPTYAFTTEACGGKESLVSLCVLLLDKDGGEWAGPSLTLYAHHKSNSILLLSKAFGVLERWIQWENSLKI